MELCSTITSVLGLYFIWSIVLILTRFQESELPPTIAPQPLIDELTRFASFAADTYCMNLTTGSRVGVDGTILWNTGNGATIQRVYIAHSASLGIIVGYEGTNKSSFASLSDDINFMRVSPVKALDWLNDDGVQIAKGFQGAWLDTAQQVLEQVEMAKNRFPDMRINLIGHSMGAASALLGALHIQHSLTIDVKVVGFGLPRMGNQAFAETVDEQIHDQTHVVNYHDIIPHLPGKFLGYRHPSGEVWIANKKGDLVYQCPGFENVACSDSIHLFHYDLEDHDGPYLGNTYMDCTERT